MPDPSAPPMRAGSFTPIRALEVELAAPIQSIPGETTQNGAPFGRGRVLVRIHTLPLGFVDVVIPASGVSAASLAAAIELELGFLVRRHLEGDALPAPEVVDAEGLPHSAEPRCLDARRRTLDAATFVSVVVPTVDRPEALRRCLDDLARQQYPQFEIIVVDNDPAGSGAEAVVSSLGSAAAAIRYVVERRRGSSRARNKGLEQALGDIVAFVDADVRVDRFWLSALATSMAMPLSNHEHASCVTGAILSADIETQPQLWMEEWGGYSKGLERQIFNMHEHRRPNRLYPFAAAAFGSGANMAFRTSALRRIGGFDVALGGGTPSQGGEDLAAFLDLIRRGGTLIYEPAAIVWHQHPTSEEQFHAKLHAYGIGLASFLSRHATRHPTDVIRIAVALPSALAYFFRADSEHNRSRSSSFPRGLWRREVAGMIRGPFAYALGRSRSAEH